MQKMNELESRAASSLQRALGQAEAMDAVKQLEARSHIFGELQKMKDEGQAITLSDEEMTMLSAFRRFKTRMTKQGQIFTWQTRMPEGVAIVEETALIRHPQE